MRDRVDLWTGSGTAWGVVLIGAGGLCLASPPSAPILPVFGGWLALTWWASRSALRRRVRPPRPAHLLARTGWTPKGWVGVPMPVYGRPGTVSCHFLEPMLSDPASRPHARFADAMEAGAGVVHLSTRLANRDGFVETAARCGRIHDLYVVDLRDGCEDRIDLLSDDDVRDRVLSGAGVGTAGLLLDGILRRDAASGGLPTTEEAERILSLPNLVSVHESLGRDASEAWSRTDVAVASYLGGLSGFRSDRGVDQPASVRRDHREATDALLRVVGPLRDILGHPGEAETSLSEIVSKRRIVSVLLPEIPSGASSEGSASLVVLEAVLAAMAQGSSGAARPMLLSIEDLDVPTRLHPNLRVDNAAVVLTRTIPVFEDDHPPPLLPALDQAVVHAGAHPGSVLGPAFDPSSGERLRAGRLLHLERGSVVEAERVVPIEAARRPSAGGWRRRFLDAGALS